MSYVIQNFYELNKKVTLTPRFKYFFFLNNINKFILFIKFNNLFKFTQFLNFSTNSYISIFIKHFFLKSHLKILNSLNLENVNFYLNNLTKSYIYLILNNCNNYFKINNKFNLINTSNWQHDTYLFNLYYFPLRTVKFRINNNFFKNIFFFFMLHSTFLWYSHYPMIKFYLNFILPNSYLKLNRFYSSYFLKVYNY